MKKSYHKDGCCCDVHHETHNDIQCVDIYHQEENCNCDQLQHEESTIEEDQESNANHKYLIHNLDCANCAMKIEKAIFNQDYIEEATLNFSTQILIVKSKLSDEVLLPKLNQIVEKIEPGVEIKKINGTKTKEQSHTFEFAQLIIAGVCFILALYLEKQVSFNSIYLYIFVYIVAGYKVLYTAFRNIFKGNIFDENFLMSIATLGAFYVGDFKEAVAVMLFYDVGELFQSIAVHRSRSSISDLMGIHSDTATILKEGTEVIVSPEEIQVNDILIVKAGERIAVDGIVLKGNSSLDVSALTGESLPKDIGVDDEILAGSLNVYGVFTMRASKVASESTVSRVLDLVENASSKKAKIENFITRFAKVYTPFVVLAAALIIILPPFFGWGSFDEWLYRGCTFLIISCPCALVISVPLGLFAGIGAASRKGVLVKGGNYLELLNDMDTIIFDKTGTITKGIFKVQKINGDADVLQLAAYGESYSNHPIAQSIVKAYGEKIDQSKMSEYQELAGLGISTMYNGKTLLVGNDNLLSNENIDFELSSDLGSIIYVAYDGNFKGSIIVNDEIKETSNAAMKQLKQLGVSKTVMLTGDKREIAQLIANEVGIDEVHAQLLPQDKVTILESYLNETHKVGFVGDGINDAPVLMRSDIGIAMGGLGSDAAIEASDIVLMNDDLLSITSAILIAKKTKRILWQNISFSLLIKFGVLGLTIFGLTNMWMGVFADVGVTLIAIINAMRILKN